MSPVLKSFFIGLVGFFGLLFLYFSLMLLATKNYATTIAQFGQLWYFILILSVGFGIQVGLYHYIKGKKAPVSSSILKTSGAASTISMIACCAHHLTDVLPLIGFSAISIFLLQYQIYFLLLGIASNMAGIGYLLRIIWQKNESQIFSF